MSKPELVTDAVMLRVETSDLGTFSRFTTGHGGWLWTIEPPWRNNSDDISCIPAGDYEVRRHTSPTKGDCYLVIGVPDREHVLFHIGNVAGDLAKGYKSNSKACIMPGMSRGLVYGQIGVKNSTDALNKIKELAPPGFRLSIASSCHESFKVK